VTQEAGENARPPAVLIGSVGPANGW
jgi:hypothetical protein